MRSVSVIACEYVLSSQLFSIPVCRYPTSGIAETTFSPSSSSSTRSTPCVEGCCGPIFRTIVFVLPTADSTVCHGSQSTSRNLTLALRREIPPQGSSFKTVGQKNAPQIRMSFKANSEEVENFSFHPVRTRPDRHKRFDDWLLRTHAGAQSYPFAPLQRNQLIVQLEPRLNRKPIDARCITQ